MSATINPIPEPNIKAATFLYNGIAALVDKVSKDHKSYGAEDVGDFDKLLAGILIGIAEITNTLIFGGRDIITDKDDLAENAILTKQLFSTFFISFSEGANRQNAETGFPLGSYIELECRGIVDIKLDYEERKSKLSVVPPE